MKKFRKIWLVMASVVTLLFGIYCVFDFLKTDADGPVISGGGDRIEVSIRDGEDVLMEGITAMDAKDGDVTDSLIVEKISNFYDNNLRTVTYAAFDSDNHISKVEREISYKDYTGPRFELSGSLRFRAGENVNIDKIVTAQDCLDGDLSSKIKIRMETTISNRMIGFYQVDYVVTNSAGDTEVLPIEIEIYEPVNNEVELNLDRYLIYYDGKEPEYTDYLVNIRRGNLEYAFEGTEAAENLTTETTEETEETEDEVTSEETESASQIIPKSRVRVESLVDASQPGVYPVYYHYTEERENYTVTAKEVLYVVVE